MGVINKNGEVIMDLTAYAGKQFVASFSGGKDSTLALHRAITAGMKPLGLITTWNTDMGRSWFHGLPHDVRADTLPYR